MEKRIGVIGIVIEDMAQTPKVNETLSAYVGMITGRMGIPDHDAKVGVISLIVKGTTDEIGGLTGRLGQLPGVLVKSALTSKTAK